MQMVERMRGNAPSTYFGKVRNPVPDHSYLIKRPSPKKSAKCGQGGMAPRLVVPTMTICVSTWYAPSLQLLYLLVCIYSIFAEK